MGERYSFPLVSLKGAIGSTMSEAELADLWEEVKRDRALWFWEWRHDLSEEGLLQLLIEVNRRRQDAACANKSR